MTGVVAGVVVETVPGAVARVAARLGQVPGVTLQGGDGDRRLALTWEAADGRALEAAAERLLREDGEILGVFPTFLGEAED